MRSELMLAINQLCAERKLSREVVLEALEASLVSAYKRNFGSASNIEVRIEPNTGEVRVFAIKEVVENVTDRKAQISLEEARQINPAAQIGNAISIESTPKDFGRIAAQTAKQVILQRIREAEREALFSSFADSEGEIAHGTIQSQDFHSGDVIVSLDGAEAVLPAKEQVPTERYRRGARLRAYVLEVRKGSRGPQITLSRKSPLLLRRLLELEVPEILNGTVEIKAIAREAGSRAKVAVHATQEGVDPVGSCVGVRGGRIQNIVNELGGEKIDVVQWSSDVAAFIANALSPAKVMNVLLEDDPITGKTATVIVPDRQLSLAIGKDGQNARLAAKLTGWRIDIKSASEAAEETLGRLEDSQVSPEKMDLLTLAETYLKREEGFSQAEQVLIEASLQTEGAEIPWPAEEPGSLVLSQASAEVEGEAGKQIEPAELEIVETNLEAVAPASAVVVEASVSPETESTREEPIGEELPLPEELVEESMGWAAPSPVEEYVVGWPDQEDLEEWEAEWDREELDEDEEEEDLRKRGKKKKKKRGGKRSLGYEDEYGIGSWRGRKPSRYRGW
ncbi:MAG: transcription termination factor NusA [Anaerolineae bacterium]